MRFWIPNFEGRWTSGMNTEARYNRKEHQRCKDILRLQTYRGIILTTGGHLKVTRGPSCAAAADDSVTFGSFVEFHAAWARWFVAYTHLLLG